jgi:tetratricopeptide (TPR) repeat protein
LAKASLEDCLKIAQQIPSVQLEVRALTQLSNVMYNSDHDEQAIDYAERATKLAQENNLEYWATDGQIREANAYLDRGRPEDLASAKRLLLQALKAAQDHQHPHLEANAQFTLASLGDKQENRDEQIERAQPALKYYVDFGYLTQANDTENLIVRAEQGKGNLTQALTSATELVRLAKRSGSSASLESAEEVLGGVLFQLQEYPNALVHYQEALNLSATTHENVAYQALHCADVLWRLGRYDDASTVLNSITGPAAKRPDIALGMNRAKAEMLLSQRRFSQALAIATKWTAKNSQVQPDDLVSFKKVSSIAKAYTGRAAEAQQDAHDLLALAQQQRDERLIADAQLTQAMVGLKTNSPQSAKVSAESANIYFSSKGEKESDWLSMLFAAQASGVLGDKTASALKTKQVVDKLHGIEQNWSPAVFAIYRTRPDIQVALKRSVILGVR